ncbi:hypothetical protein B0H19DRAFT_1095001 [Mycena capillaripes]|nr:hypothetical protein B0H19DRAFT_1095001 [Mycena capillaripes]
MRYCHSVLLPAHISSPRLHFTRRWASLAFPQVVQCSGDAGLIISSRRRASGGRRGAYRASGILGFGPTRNGAPANSGGLWRLTFRGHLLLSTRRGAARALQGWDAMARVALLLYACLVSLLCLITFFFNPPEIQNTDANNASVLYYVVRLVIYAMQVLGCFIGGWNSRWGSWGGSHAIWHVFIVLAMGVGFLVSGSETVFHIKIYLDFSPRVVCIARCAFHPL